MKLTYFGHSAFQIETNGTTLLFDPFISDNPHTEGVVTADELDPDVIFVSHAHGDHWGDTLDIAKRSEAQIVANFEIISYAQNNGHENVQPMNTGGSFDFDWGWAMQTDARHSSSFPDGTYGGNPNGYLLDIEDTIIYFLGDTSPFPGMEYIGEDFDVDVALMPVGDCVTMGVDGALRAADMIDPSHVIPIHYNTFPFIQIDIDECERTLKDADLHTSVLKPGETVEL